MNIGILKKKLLNLIGADELFEAINLLKKSLPEGQNHSDSIAFERRLNSFRRERGLGVLSFEEQKLEENKLATGLLDMVGRLQLSDFKLEPELKKSVFSSEIPDRILFLCQNAKSQKSMEEFAQRLRFSDATVRVAQKDEDPEGYKVIIFCSEEIDSPDRARGEDRDHLELLERILREKYFVVYFGNQYGRLEDYRAYCHAANNRFSLYARIREFLEYLNHQKSS